MIELSPVWPLFIGALLAAFTAGWLRALVMLAAPLLGALWLYQLEPGLAGQTELLGYQLMPVRIDALARVFGYLFHLAALIGVIYALHLRDRVQDVAALAYAGSAVGAVFAGDLLTLFIYWELLALTSALLVFARRSDRALAAGMRYLLLQVGSGVLLLAGTLLYSAEGNSLAFEHIGLDAPGGALIFLAFGIKSAFPLLHGWLTDAYPEATPTGTVFLSAFTTKVAIYALARGFAGTELLIYIGALMACWPMFYAVIENDLRRVLAYSLISQLGFMVVGIGIGTELALNGTVAHACVHVLYKGLLMMCMGAVLQVTGEIRGSELGGLYKRMPKTTLLCLVGAASISAVPLFSGFVSKSMLLSAALQQGYGVIWLTLLFASAGVLHYVGIKIPFCAFFGPDSTWVASAHEPPRNMLVAMTLAAALCLAIGGLPEYFYALLPYRLDYSPYDVSHVLAQLQLLVFSALAFTWLKLSAISPPELRSVNLDADWCYRRGLPRVIARLCTLVAPWDQRLRQASVRLAGRTLKMLDGHHGQQGVMARGWTTGSMVLWVALLLGLSLMLYYF